MCKCPARSSLSDLAAVGCDTLSGHFEIRLGNDASQHTLHTEARCGVEAWVRSSGRVRTIVTARPGIGRLVICVCDLRVRACGGTVASSGCPAGHPAVDWGCLFCIGYFSSVEPTAAGSIESAGYTSTLGILVLTLNPGLPAQSVPSMPQMAACDTCPVPSR
jgi:hypothetical protein